nr:MAG TPA: hypothetical protein [Caudoviricetes sp.]
MPFVSISPLANRNQTSLMETRYCLERKEKERLVRGILE